MSVYDTVTIVIAAFLNGWFVSGLVRLETEGNRWPLVKEFLFTTFRLGVIIQGVMSFSWWLNYHHLLPWQSFIVSPCIDSAGAAVLVYRNEMRKRFHIPVRHRGVT